MSKFIGRHRELEELNRILSQRGAQFILVYGHRRVGKTTLLLNWAEQSGKPFICWVANRDTPAQVRLGFTRAVWRWAHPESQAVPRFDTWEDAFETTAQLAGNQPVILILDEFSYATESDSSLASHLQAAWDHLFKDNNITIVLAGSHIGMMVDLMGYQAPLYGRFTAQLPVDPLPFAALRDFLPHYTAAERVAVYAVTGGVPAYLERFDDRRSLTENLRELFMQRTSIFRTDLVEQELSQVLWDRISDQFRAFVEVTAFEDLCREWVLLKARAGKLPMVPEAVGGGQHRGAHGQVKKANPSRENHPWRAYSRGTCEAIGAAEVD